MRLQFGDLSRPIELIDCDDLVPSLAKVFPGWPIVPTRGDAPPVLSLSRRADGYRLAGEGIEQPLERRDAVDAICGLVAETMRALTAENDRLLCLHGAAAVFAGRLLVFPSAYRAGKSVLTACLAAAGVIIAGDDVLPIDLDSGEGVAPGLAPRLRLPLPANLDRRTRAWIGSHLALVGARYGYLDLAGEELAGRGARWPLGAFVMLQREAGAAARLETLSEAETLRQVVWQNFAREAEAPAILQRLHRHVASVDRYRLRYDRAADAVELLLETFTGWRGAPPASALDPPAPEPVTPGNTPPGCYRRREGIHVIEVEGERFLADAEGAAIHHLNLVGGSIWSLLEEPIGRAEIVDVLRAAFPDADARQIDADVDELLAALTRRGLVRYGGAGPRIAAGEPEA